MSRISIKYFKLEAMCMDCNENVIIYNQNDKTLEIKAKIIS